MSFPTDNLFPFFLDMFVKQMFLHSRANEFDASVGIGWTYDVPRLLYKHICLCVLKVLQDKIAATPDFNVEEVTSESGYAPYSQLEFNDEVVKEYVSCVTQGNAEEKAIFYKTHPSRRNRPLGEFCEFVYHAYEAPDPNQVVQVVEDRERNGRTYPEKFWPEVCRAQIVIEGGGRPLEYGVMVRTVLVGSLMLKVKPGLLGPREDEEKETITKAFELEIFGKWITERHRVSVFFRDFESFRDFVKNAKTNHWRFNDYPDFASVKSAPQRRKIRATVDLIQAFQLDQTGDQFSDVLNQQIMNAIRRRVCHPFMLLGLRAMNADYVDFILRMREQYEATLTILLNREGQDNYVRIAKKLAADYVKGVIEFHA